MTTTQTDPITFDSDRTMTVCGVEGRLTHRTRKPGQAPGLWTRQRWIASRPYDAEGFKPGSRITVEVCFDDDCSNGHNSFAITGHVKEPRTSDWSMAGCIHDEIASAFPELAHLIKWHSCSTDGPMHYVANTVYLAGDADHNDRRAGEVERSEPAVAFDNVPALHMIKDSFAVFLRERIGTGDFLVMTVPYDDFAGRGYNFGPKYTLVGYGEEWHKAPFDSMEEAQAFADSLNHHSPRLVDVPTAYSEGKARQLNAARSVAVWPEATDAELSAPRDELRAALEARLPQLLAEFRADVEGIGFYWSAEDYKPA